MFKQLKKCKKGSYFFYRNPQIYGVALLSEGGGNILLCKLSYNVGLKRYRCGIVTNIHRDGTTSGTGEMNILSDQIVFPVTF